MLSQIFANFYLDFGNVIAVYIVAGLLINLINFFVNVVKVERYRVLANDLTEKSLFRWHRYIRSGGFRLVVIMLVGTWNWMVLASIRSGLSEKVLHYLPTQLTIIIENLRWGFFSFFVVTILFLLLQVVVGSRDIKIKKK